MVRRGYKIKRSLEKTLPDLWMLATGGAPAFVYGGAVRGLPIFTYHIVDASFERDLAALHDGGYRTAGTGELLEWANGARRPDGRVVALTFDDGHASLGAVAVPLLERFGYRAIAFVVSGLVPDRSTDTLTGWRQLSTAVARGTLEVGAHSLFHHHVPVSASIVGVVTATTATHFAANIPVPRWPGDSPVPIGTPILAGRPRYVARPAFRPAAGEMERIASLAARAGAAELGSGGWWRTVQSEPEVRGSIETLEEADAAIADDIRVSIERIVERCPNPAARHVCYPWYSGDERTHRVARRAGAVAVYGGVGMKTMPA
ncbi:MAG: polysaccharide deacetylase family protein, partial [Gemmatimonadaceae bacterium]